MITCKRCLYTSFHPLGLTFEDGVCSGCRVHEEKLSLDWSERFKKLGRIADAFRNQSGNNYDCVVPVSGARDSFFIVHTLIKKLGLNPLLVTYNKQYNTPLGIRNLGRLRTIFDRDILTMTMNPEVVKTITRATLRRYGSVYWHCLAGQSVFPVQVAVRYKIPLIIWGAHQGMEQVGMFSHEEEVEMTRRYRKEHDLLGVEAEDLVSDFDQVCATDVMPYCYPNEEEIGHIGVRGIYLGNYIPWDVKAQHDLMLETYGYETSVQSGTFDTYSDCDCFVYSGVHDYLKWVRCGYGKALDHAVRELRWGRLDRDEASKIVSRHPSRIENLDLFLEWIGLTENAFHFIADLHRNPRFWKRDGNFKWKFEFLADKATHQPESEAAATLRGPCQFSLFKQEEAPEAPARRYQLFGTGNHSHARPSGFLDAVTGNLQSS